MNKKQAENKILKEFNLNLNDDSVLQSWEKAMKKLNPQKKDSVLKQAVENLKWSEKIMKIFNLELKTDFPAGYDCTCSMTIVAEDEKQARKLAYEYSLNSGGDEDPDLWLVNNTSSCQEIDLNKARVISESPMVQSYNLTR